MLRRRPRGRLRLVRFGRGIGVELPTSHGNIVARAMPCCVRLFARAQMLGTLRQDRLDQDSCNRVGGARVLIRTLETWKLPRLVHASEPGRPRETPRAADHLQVPQRITRVRADPS